MNISTLYNSYCESFTVSTDTRKIQAGSLFFALKGDNFNGNAFAQKAVDQGASLVVIDEKAYEIPGRTVLVKDVLGTLQELAAYHRKQLGIPIIALTGSNGKTTTKELIQAVLVQQFKTTATVGNLNNHIGVPLTLLRMNRQTELGIVEMGANHPGEIATLCEIAQPDFGYITNFGKAHLEGFKSLEGVIKAKTELYKHLKEHNKKVFVNTNDAEQVRQAQDMTQIRFGSKSPIKIELLNADPLVCVTYQQQDISSQLIGAYNFNNIAAAIAMGHYFKVDLSLIKKAIEAYIPTNNRSQIIQKYGLKIILDAYNANPSSMHAALTNFQQLSDQSKVVLLGDMFELGATAAQEHQEIANQVAAMKLKKAFLIGDNFNKTRGNPSILKYASFTEFATDFTSKTLSEGTTVLIKGSRGMALERVLDLLG